MTSDRPKYRLLQLSIKDRSELTDAELVELLELRYGPVEVPPCRVCGGVLQVASIGGGMHTKYTCSQWQQPIEGLETYDHYRHSEWYDHKDGGDSVVLELIRRFQGNK